MNLKMKMTHAKSKRKFTKVELERALRYYACVANYVNREASDGTTDGWLKTVVITKDCGRIAKRVLGLR